MRSTALLLAFVTASFLTAQEKANPKEQLEKIKELQTLRMKVLKAAVVTSITLAQNARIDIEQPLTDVMALLKAELEETEKESDRIPLYERTVERLERLEEIANARLRVARGSVLSLQRLSGAFSTEITQFSLVA